MAVLNVFKLRFKVDNDCGLMVEGGGVLYRRRGGSWHLGCGSADREAAGVGLDTRPEEDEGRRAPVVRERRGGGRWAGGSGSVMVGWAAWAGRQAKAEADLIHPLSSESDSEYGREVYMVVTP
jgi:hypothetical protein